jgi:hypothetical protein
MSETKKAYLKKEIIDTLKEHGVMIGVNGSPATLSKKDDHYFIHIDRNLLFSTIVSIFSSD